jgi:maleate isomerase
MEGSKMTKDHALESSDDAPAEPRVGVMIPASDVVVERDFARYLPRHISFHVARLMQALDAPAAGTKNLDGMIDYLPEAARSLLPAETNLVLFCCTSASFYRGPRWNKELDEQVSKLTGRPAVTTSTALLRALAALKAKKFYLVTPYPEHVNKSECDFFHANGVEITGVHTFNCRLSKDIGEISPPRILGEVIEKKKEAAAADCVLISCTGLRSFEIAEEAERSIGKPVITSNMASLWVGLDHFGTKGAGVPRNALFEARSYSGPTTFARA